MSKNFELLRQAGWKQDYFDSAQTETPPPRKSTPSANRPPVASPPARRRPRSVPPDGDQISSLVSRLFLDPRASHVRAVVFCGIAGRAGCTWACAQTARTLAALVDGTVCVVDANFSAPSLHGQFNVDNLVGFSDAIVQGKPARSLVRQIDSSNLHILAAGGECARVRTESSRVTQALRELRGEFDYLLIDAPAVGNGSAANGVARGGDGAILVVESQGVALDSLLRVKERLRSAGVSLFGVVLNDRKSPSQSSFGQFLK